MIFTLGIAAALLHATPVMASTTPAKSITFTDLRGKQFTLAAKPKRIVALIPNIAEALLDLDADAPLIGAPEYTTLPQAVAPKVKTLGPYNRLNAEQIYSLKPDLVIASLDGNEATVVDKLEKLGATVISLNSTNLKDVVRSLEILAAISGAPNSPKLAQLKIALTPSPETSPRPRIFFQIGWDPIVTVSRQTFIGELLDAAGASNIFADGSIRYPRPSPEHVIAANPDIIILCQLTRDGRETSQARAFWDRFPNIAAVRNKHVYVVQGDLFVKPGFDLVRGISELRKLLK